MSAPPVLDRVVSEVDRAADEIVRFTADLVRIPTINPPGEAYEPCARLIGDRLTRGGFEVEYIAAGSPAWRTWPSAGGSRRAAPTTSSFQSRSTSIGSAS